MGAPELLHHLRGAGLAITLTPAGALHVAPRSFLTDEHRNAIRAERDALVLTLQIEERQPPSSRCSGNPPMTAQQGDECHFGDWDDVEIDAFAVREARFTRMGRADADDLAERLTLRDRQGDDRRICLECTHLGERGRCIAASAGRIKGTHKRLEPVPTILQRCEAFGLMKGLL